VRLGGDGPFADTLDVMRGFVGKTAMRFASRANTVIGVVATNAGLTKDEANKVAQMAHDGLARAVRPAHTLFDGDTIFALSTGEKNVCQHRRRLRCRGDSIGDHAPVLRRRLPVGCRRLPISVPTSEGRSTSEVCLNPALTPRPPPGMLASGG
jgi:hypothetical protein